MSEYKNHPAADLFPMMEGSEYLSFRASIEAQGQLNTVKVWNDLVLDGRNRVKACKELGIAIQYEEVTTDDPVGYVVAQNIDRRQMTTAQRAAIAADLANLKRGTNRYGEKVDPQNCGSKTYTTGEAAKLMQVSPRSVESAKTLKETDPEAHEAAKRGSKPKKKKSEAEKRVSWQQIASDEGFPLTSKSTLKNLRAEIVAVDPAIWETATNNGILVEMEPRLRAALRQIKAQKSGRTVVEENEAAAESILLPESWQQKLDRKLAATERAREADYEMRIHARVQVELQIMLDQYNALADKYKKTIAAYKGVFSRVEYKSLLGLLHTDRLPGLDDVQRAKYERMFNLVKTKEFALCGDDGSTAGSTLPKTVADLMAMKRKKRE